jgi:hypothetical protein
MSSRSYPITVTAAVAVAVPEPHAGFTAAAMVAGCLIYRCRRVRPTRKNERGASNERVTIKN